MAFLIMLRSVPRRAVRARAWIVLAALSALLGPGVVGRDFVPTKRASAAAPTMPPPTSPGLIEESQPVRAGDVDVNDVFARADVVREVSAAPASAKSSAAAAVDGRDDSAWTGAADGKRWQWRVDFRSPRHLSLLRARFGRDTTSGIPTLLHWEASAPDADGTCAETIDDARFTPIPDAFDDAWGGTIRPTSRSWFVDVDACALELSIEATNGGPPIVREISAIEGARDVLRGALVEADSPGSDLATIVDGTYDHGWSGAANDEHLWTITVHLPTAEPIDRVHLVLAEDATSAPRANGIGRKYGMAGGPVRYRVEGSADGSTFSLLANEPHDVDGSIVPVRRRLITFAPRMLQTIRLVIDGATDDAGRPSARAFPMVREISAYRADDRRPLLFAPWILSVNANPSGESHLAGPNGELANDVFWTKFLQIRFSPWIPALRRDDRYARALGGDGKLLDATRTDASGAALEAIEGDDATLDLALLENSTPRPIVVLSGSNQWDYARKTGPERKNASKWRWDPLVDAKRGGMGQLASAVAARVAPFVGFCGGGQILALLEARSKLPASIDDAQNAALIDRILRRTTGGRIHGILPVDAIIHAWPGDGRPRTAVAFDPREPLFADVAGPTHRRVTHEFPESHADVVRPDAFLEGAPLASFRVVAKSVFCGAKVIDGGPLDKAFPDPNGPGRCLSVPEVWRSTGPGFPVVGTQFHAEQYDFPAASTDDPPESTADARLLLAAEYEEIVDAYVKYASP